MTSPTRRAIYEAAGLAEHPVGAVLSILQDQLVCEVDELYVIIEHVSGDPVWSHALPERADQIRPFLADVYPTLALVAAAMPTFSAEVPAWEALTNDQKRAHITDWIADNLIDYGLTVVVPRRPAGYGA